jgi:site-specific recombinase XerD
MREVRAFLLDLTQERKVAFSTFNQAPNAVRFFCTAVLTQPCALDDLHFRKPPHRLPVVMNDEEVFRLLECAPSLRDRALFETAYATGRRLSEVTRLPITDIDSTRMVVRVIRARVGRIGT